MSEAIVPIRRDAAGNVIMLDQTQLPLTEIYHTYQTAEEVAQAIETMIIRGAPAIGVAAAFGLALGARDLSESGFSEEFGRLCQRMASTRPTAVNLFWAIEKMKTLVANFQLR